MLLLASLQHAFADISIAVEMPAKAGILAIEVKPATVCREANYSMDTINMKDDLSSTDNRHIMGVNS
jgi:hypothetical protein